MGLSHLVWLLLFTGAAAYLMVAAGVAKNMLEWRRLPRSCASCGCDKRRCRCHRSK